MINKFVKQQASLVWVIVVALLALEHPPAAATVTSDSTTWEGAYEADTQPLSTPAILGEAGWEDAGGGNGNTIVVSDGPSNNYINYDYGHGDGTGSYEGFKYLGDTGIFDGNLLNPQTLGGIALEFRIRVHTGTFFMHFYPSSAADARHLAVYVSDSNITLLDHDEGASGIANTNGTGQWTTFRITCDDTTWKVYRDTDQSVQTSLPVVHDGGPYGLYRIALYGVSVPTDFDLDYIRWTNNGGFGPDPTPEAGGTIPVALHSRGGAAGVDWPLTFGVPFPEGALTDNANVRLVDANSQEVPIQIRTSANWLSGSVRWVLIDTQAPLPPGEATYFVQWGTGVVRSAVSPDQVTVTDGASTVMVDTGPLQFTLTKDDMRLFTDMQVLGADQQMHPVFPGGQDSELLLEKDDGTLYLGSLVPAADVVIEEAGPLRVSIKLEGWMQSAGGAQLGRRIVRVQAFAGKRWLRLYDTWVKTGDSNDHRYNNISFHLPCQGSQVAFPETPDATLRPVNSSDYLLQYEHDKYETVSNGAVVATGAKAPGRVTVGQGDALYSVAIRHFWQTFPREIEVTPGLVKLHFWPAHGKTPTHLGANMTEQNIGAHWWVHEGQVLDFEEPAEFYNILTGSFNTNSRCNAFGIARTSEYWLDLHGGGDPAPAAATFHANPVPVVDPNWLAESQAFWNIAPWREPYLEVEKATASPLEFFEPMYERIGDYGMWNYGAYHKTYYPTLDWAQDHRHWMGIHHGGPRWPWLVYARSGDPNYLDFAEINARHCMDVATANWEELAYNQQYWDTNPNSSAWLSLKYLGGHCEYNTFMHWGGGSRAAYNSIVDYTLWYYYLTGYQRAWDVAMNHGEYLLRWNDGASVGAGDPSNPADSNAARTGMGRGAAAITFYRATGDTRHLGLANNQMAYFRQQTDNETTADQGFREMYYAPFVERYYEVTGDTSLEPYIVKWAGEWMNPPQGGEGENIINGVLPAGREHWAIRDTFYNFMALGYQLTGDDEFLHTGLQQARLFLEHRATGADPLMENVALFKDFPGVAGYTAQQLGHFVKALNEYEQSTGQTLPVPDPAGTSLIGVPFRISDSNHGLVFHLRKAADERVEIPFRFRTLQAPSDGSVIIEDPNGIEILNQKLTNVNNVLSYDLTLVEAATAGDYRVAFNSVPQGTDLLTTIWPPRTGMWSKVVVELPIQATTGVRLYFMPRQLAGGRVQLYTSLRPDDFHTHRLYKPDGSLAYGETLQLGPPHKKGDTYLLADLAVDSQDQGLLWTFTRMMYGHAWLEGDVHPAVSFRPEDFFLPDRFIPVNCGDFGTFYKSSDVNEDCYVDDMDIALFAIEWLTCNDPLNHVCD